MRSSAYAIAAVLVRCSALAGCTETPTVTRSAHRRAASAPASRAAPAPSSTADLAALKKAAGIADCPTSDAAVDAVASRTA